jgi:hypothetical protein
MEFVLPAAVTPVITLPMSIVRPTSDVDPGHDDHSPTRLRRSCTQHCDTRKHCYCENDCANSMKKLSSHFSPPSLVYTSSRCVRMSEFSISQSFRAKIRNSQQDFEMKVAPTGLYKPNLVYTNVSRHAQKLRRENVAT